MKFAIAPHTETAIGASEAFSISYDNTATGSELAATSHGTNGLKPRTFTRSGSDGSESETSPNG